ncbi:MAG: A/G-specific adenine glycosylase, partial [Polaribacter sp.]|nr:A/G-specific adenine glycosylase [Polaribacter sp.]
MIFSEILIFWYKKNKRELPWRNTKKPYFIWLSEIMLQQTRVAQGMSYYLKFTESYPTVSDLANASETEVLKMWQGLGYYSRARNLHFTAKYIAHELNGKFPSTFKEIITLKGIGDYTASAIA